MNNINLTEMRERIDRLDEKLVDLLEERAQVALDIGALKKRKGWAVHDRVREQAVLNRLAGLAEGRPLAGELMKDVFREIIKACRTVQAPPRVALLGPVGTFSHAAAVQHFGSGAEYLLVEDLADVFRTVETGQAEAALVPVENSSEGIVGRTLDLLAKSNLKACGQITLDINHCLLAQSADISKIVEVASHPQALAQCRHWLELNLPAARQVTVSSTSAAAQLAGREATVAAISDISLAESHGLAVLAENIQDQSRNQTTFLLLSRETTPPSGGGRDRTLVSFTASDGAGSLYASLKNLAETGVNITKLNSRPSPDQPWEYIFFLEIEGHFQDEKTAEALERLAAHSQNTRLLGSYEPA